MEIIETLKRYFRQKEDVSFAFLFGSHTRDSVYKESDVDIAIFWERGYYKEKADKIGLELENLLKRPVDIITLNTCNAKISDSAIKGLPLIIKDRQGFISFMLEKTREAEDYRNFVFDLQRLRDEIKKRRHDSH